MIWTDSNYVKQGITEWIHGWKKKNWKDVKNPRPLEKTDATCANGVRLNGTGSRAMQVHPGNEMADQLANLGQKTPL